MPQKSTFAYGLMEITTGGGTLGESLQNQNNTVCEESVSITSSSLLCRNPTENQERAAL